MKTNGKLLEIHARELVGMPEAWRAWSFGTTRDGDRILGHVVTGAIVPTWPCTDRAMWHARVTSTEATASFTLAAHEAWVRDWEWRTGLCRTCVGTGKSVDSAYRGTYMDCPGCKGSGCNLKEVA